MGASPLENTDHMRRYARHLVLNEIGESGQDALIASSVLVIGAGGLGSAALAYLAAAGVGTLGIAEHDRVELSNLQRQLLYETSDIGRPKVDAAKDRLEEINTQCRINAHGEKIVPENAQNLIAQYDIIIDGSDNFATRFALQEACYHAKKTLISAAITGFEAQLSTFKPHLGAPHPCYRCLVPHMPEQERNCAQEGIIGPLAGMVGSMQALEAIKELLAIGESLSGKLWRYNALDSTNRYSILHRSEDCAVCSKPL